MAQFTITVGDRRNPTDRRVAYSREEASAIFAEVLPAHPEEQVTLSENGNVVSWVGRANGRNSRRAGLRRPLAAPEGRVSYHRNRRTMTQVTENRKRRAMPRIKIFTSSWYTQLPVEVQRIGISRGTPRGQPAGYRMLSQLAPGPWFHSVSPAEYHHRFMAQLAQLDPNAVIARIEELAGAKPMAALLCFEKPADPAAWCHRGQVSGWFHDRLGIEVFEYGLEAQGCGWRHPKLLPEFQK